MILVCQKTVTDVSVFYPDASSVRRQLRSLSATLQGDDFLHLKKSLRGKQFVVCSLS